MEINGIYKSLKIKKLDLGGNFLLSGKNGSKKLMKTFNFMSSIEILSMNGLIFKSAKAFKEDILMPLLNPEIDEY